MHFKQVKARPDWRVTANELGYLSTIMDDPPYWVEALDEPFCAVFTTTEIEQLIMPATQAVIEMAEKTVEQICEGERSTELFNRLKTPIRWREAIKTSWRNRERTLWGRLDFSYSDGKIKLLELNFDGAISLYEASLFQRIWLDHMVMLKQLPPSTSQVNIMHERLVESFKEMIPADKTVHFTSVGDSAEDDDTIRYIQSCAVVATRKTAYLKVSSLGHDKSGRLIDLKDAPIEYLVKLYPWQLLFEEDTKVAEKHGTSVLLPQIQNKTLHVFEPAWKSLLSNKGTLAIMRELFPDSPYLLKAAIEGTPEADELQKKPYAKKPLHGMQGSNVSLIFPDDPSKNFTTPGAYGREGFLIQELHPLPKHSDYHVLLGSWIINNQPSGIGIRADRSPITTGEHCLFVPHIVEMPS